MTQPSEKVVFADPKMDLPFKKVFGTREHKDLLIELLNALLRLPAEARIVDLEYMSSEQLPHREGLKLSILDVKCTDARGTRYVVEMQVFPVDGFEKRVVFNACKAYVEQLGVGKDYIGLNDVIAVSICNFSLFGDRVKMLSRWRMQEQDSGETGLEQVQYVFLELPKYGAGDEPRDIVDQWAYFFREAQSLQSVPRSLLQGPVGRALEVMRRHNFSEEEWTQYQREKMAEQDFHGGLAYARKLGEAEGRKLGEAEGRKLGEAEGRKLGETEGRKLGETEGRKLGKSEGLREAVLTVCELLGIAMSAARRAKLAKMEVGELDELLSAIKRDRVWPGAARPARSR